MLNYSKMMMQQGSVSLWFQANVQSKIRPEQEP